MRGGPRHLTRLELVLLPAIVLAWFAAITTHPESAFGQWVSNIGLITAPLYASAACLSRAFTERGHRRWAWAALSVSALSWSCGQAAWTIYESLLGQELPFPSYADLGYLGALPFLFLGLCMLPMAPLSTATQLRGVL